MLTKFVRTINICKLFCSKQCIKSSIFIANMDLMFSRGDLKCVRVYFIYEIVLSEHLD